MEKRFTSLLKPWHSVLVLKITSGVHRGRLIKTLPGTATRPTSERLRQSWMNSLQMRLGDARILDLFSGSGALGLEALSRGAGSVLFVEENPKAARIIAENAKQLVVEDRVEILNRKVEKILPELLSKAPFDFIFMDPPYECGHEEKLLASWPWDQILNPEGLLCIESAYRKEGGFAPPHSLKIARDERYGDSQLTFYALTERTQLS
ncbi:MAG: 16S rRNA (guanine(966)-N(2))-methyltransferase RsmD [Bdellovibrionales bacterium]|nr:16S rRNA (guanine(966)-N(2))-methyltransferase RsmD [Bdellovibrionales bacterium]